jgi:hypothetical protein
MTKKTGLSLIGFLVSFMSFQSPASAHERPSTATADHETVMITPKVSFISNPQTRRHPAQISGTEAKVTRTGANISTYTEGTPYGYTNVIAVMPPKGSGRANMVERTQPFPSARAAERARKARVQQLISENGGA